MTEPQDSNLIGSTPHPYVPSGIPTWRTCGRCGRGANASVHRTPADDGTPGLGSVHRVDRLTTGFTPSNDERMAAMARLASDDISDDEAAGLVADMAQREGRDTDLGQAFMIDDRDGLDSEPPFDEVELHGTDDTHLAHARYLGADAALAAASWLTVTESDARSILSDVDPEVMDRYPEPTLGEWEQACDETLGMQLDLPRWDDAVGNAWLEGRDAVWGDALQATALRVLGEVDNALRVEAGLEAIVASYRSAAGLS